MSNEKKPMLTLQIFNDKAAAGQEDEVYCEVEYAGSCYDDHIQMSGKLPNGEAVCIRVFFCDLPKYQKIRENCIASGMTLDEKDR